MLKISPRNYNITYVENIPKELQHCICCKDIRFISQVSVAVPLRLQQLIFFSGEGAFSKVYLAESHVDKGGLAAVKVRKKSFFILFILLNVVI